MQVSRSKEGLLLLVAMLITLFLFIFMGLARVIQNMVQPGNYFQYGINFLILFFSITFFSPLFGLKKIFRFFATLITGYFAGLIANILLDFQRGGPANLVLKELMQIKGLLTLFAFTFLTLGWFFGLVVALFYELFSGLQKFHRRN